MKIKGRNLLVALITEKGGSALDFKTQYAERVNVGTILAVGDRVKDQDYAAGNKVWFSYESTSQTPVENQLCVPTISVFAVEGSLAAPCRKCGMFHYHEADCCYNMKYYLWVLDEAEKVSVVVNA